MTVARAAISAFPYVKGESRRFTAAPTKLTPLAGKVMVASGALSTRRKVASFRISRIAGLMALVAMAAAYFLGSDPISVQTQKAEMTRSEAPPGTVCPVDQAEIMRAVCRQETRAELPDLASAAGVVDRQDRFEIDRFIRLSSAATHTGARPRRHKTRGWPSAGTAPR